MSVRDRVPRMRARWFAEAAGQAAREDAERVILDWNKRIADARAMWSSPSLRAAIVAGYPWLDVFCPACQTSRAVDIRTIDRHPEASLASLVFGLTCTWCGRDAPMPRLLGLHRFPPMGTVEAPKSG